MPGGKQFLEHFEPGHRGAVASWFYQAVRQGEDSPRRVCSHVYRYLSDYLVRWGDYPGGVRKQQVLAVMRGDRGGALALAEYAIWYESLPEAERTAIKQRNEEEGKRQWMVTQPPTNKQRSLLERLGYAGTIESRAHASELIEKLKDW